MFSLTVLVLVIASLRSRQLGEGYLGGHQYRHGTRRDQGLFTILVLYIYLHPTWLFVAICTLNQVFRSVLLLGCIFSPCFLASSVPVSHDESEDLTDPTLSFESNFIVIRPIEF
jgi:hypothetical protein